MNVSPEIAYIIMQDMLRDSEELAAAIRNQLHVRQGSSTIEIPLTELETLRYRIRVIESRLRVIGGWPAYM